MVQGQHEPLISEALPYEVQTALDCERRKKRIVIKMAAHDMLPLRGFLICPHCGRMLTGSGSQGKGAFIIITTVFHLVAAALKRTMQIACLKRN